VFGSRFEVNKYTQPGETSLTESRLCFGAWQYRGEWGKIKSSEAQSSIRQALELGITFFDSAQAYGFGISERVRGEALQKELRRDREKLVIARKGGLRNLCYNN
jgi:aryl-alcohol dehydrogenase-like predicted oxidoreductase